MSGVFQNIDPSPAHRPASVYPPPLVRGGGHTRWGEGGGGSIFWKTPDTTLYSTYISALCLYLSHPENIVSGWSKIRGKYALRVPSCSIVFAIIQ
jgi:hypothetical protein